MPRPERVPPQPGRKVESRDLGDEAREPPGVRRRDGRFRARRRPLEQNGSPGGRSREGGPSGCARWRGKDGPWHAATRHGPGLRTWGWDVALIISEDIKAALERVKPTGVKFTEV